ncbi:MAG TPA: hypothetical protein VJ806_05380 [Luteimonas sp.]|nr:hypothetical protein [Luteimonas sp.]
MAKSEFKKTSKQIEREIAQLIDSVDRSLDSSSSDSDRKGQIVISAFASLAVFAAILGFEHFVGRDSENGLSTAAMQMPPEKGIVIDSESAAFVEDKLKRIEEQAATIARVRARVAPSMPIDSQIDLIGSSANDVRSILRLPEKKPSSGSVVQPPSAALK